MDYLPFTSIYVFWTNMKDCRGDFSQVWTAAKGFYFYIYAYKHIIYEKPETTSKTRTSRTVWHG